MDKRNQSIEPRRATTASFKSCLKECTRPVAASLAAAWLVFIVIASATSVAHGNNGNGNNVNYTNGSNTQRSTLDHLPQQAQNAPGREISLNAQQLAQQRQQLSREVRAERQQLQLLNARQLRDRAQQERLAQLVLSERLADEAQRFNEIPAVANDALSEALGWYATASRRGIPGSQPIDQLVPTPVIRVVRPSR